VVNPSGVLLVLAGLWAITQLVKGDALGRLGLTGGAPTSVDTGSGSTPASPGAVATGGITGAPAQQMLLRTALALQGVPYVSVSDPPRSFNCSTFTSWVYKQALGIDLPPLTWTQLGMGSSVPVGPQYVQPGDLIFSADSEGRAYGHVGIAIDSSTKIHAPHSGEVVKLDRIDWSGIQAVRRYVGG
jgi:cell wall-associated NlpC family hydrolase